MHAKKNKTLKTLVAVLSIVLVMCLTAAGTLAWLTAKTEQVTNTFSTSDIGVGLKESENLDLKMIPGWDITKDPKAWITEGSEAAYLFVEVKESNNFDDFMTYAIADGWTLLNSDSAEEGRNIVTDNTTADTYVIYRKVTTAEQMGENSAFEILKDSKVTVSIDVTKEMMTENFTAPTLTFTAYASQLKKNNKAEFTAAEAWDNVKPATTTP
jgi:predicted ribosomally synthesized peptide with SipW-like signal peptide